jgi:hypothetical protein
MAEGAPLVITFEADLSQVRQGLEQVRDDAQRGVSVPVRAEGATGSRARQGRTPPAGATTAAQPADVREREARAQGFTNAAEMDAAREAVARSAQQQVQARQDARQAQSRPIAGRPNEVAEAMGVGVPGVQYPHSTLSAMRREAFDQRYENRQVSENLRAQRQAGVGLSAELAAARRGGVDEHRRQQLEERYREQVERGVLRQNREDRLVNRTLERVPQADRLGVEREAGARMRQLGEERLEALRASVQAYREDTKSHRDFLRDRDREQRNVVGGYRDLYRETVRGLQRTDRLARTTAREQADAFQLDILNDGPNAQRRAIRQRLGEMGAVDRADPRFAEYQRLRRQEQGLRRRTGLNTEILGMGNYMTAMFGGWEVATAARASAAAGALRSANAPMEEQLAADLAAWDAGSGGIIGSMVGFGLDPMGRRRAAAGNMQRLALATDAQTAQRRVGADYLRDLGGRVSIASASGLTRAAVEADVRRQQEVNRAKEVRDAQAAADAAQITAQRVVLTQQDFDDRVDAVRSAAYARTRETGVRDPLRDTGRAQAFVREQVQREAEALSQQQRDLSSQREQKLAEATRLADAERAAALRDIDRQRRLTAAATRGQSQAATFAARNMPIEAALSQGWAGVRGAMIGSEGEAPRDRMEAITAAVAQMAATASGIAREVQAANRGALAEQVQAQIATGGLTRASRLRLAGQPLAAALSDVDTQRRLDMDRLNREQAERLEGAGGGLSGFFQRAGILASVNARRQQADAQANAARDELRQGFFLQGSDVAAQQVTRRNQIEALLRRDPVAADVAGIVGRAREEETALRRAGQTGRADEARRLARRELELTRQNYLDSFRGQQVSKEFLFGLQPRDAEDPSRVLSTIQGAITGLNAPGRDQNPTQLLTEARDYLRTIAEKFNITN